MHACVTRRAPRALALLAATLVAAAHIACGEAPPQRLTPAPQLRRWEGFVELTPEQEAMALQRIQPLMRPLVQRVWGLPPDSVRWSAWVWVRALLDTASAMCLDTTVSPSPKERERHRFCREVEAALGPTDSARAPGRMHGRSVSIHALNIRDDTLFVNVDVGIERPCRDGRTASSSAGFQYHLLRRPRGRWHLANEHPNAISLGGSALTPESSCVAMPLVNVWGPPPRMGPPPGAVPPPAPTASAVAGPDR